MEKFEFALLYRAPCDQTWSSERRSVAILPLRRSIGLESHICLGKDATVFAWVYSDEYVPSSASLGWNQENCEAVTWGAPFGKPTQLEGSHDFFDVLRFLSFAGQFHVGKSALHVVREPIARYVINIKHLRDFLVGELVRSLQGVDPRTTDSETSSLVIRWRRLTLRFQHLAEFVYGHMSFDVEASGANPRSCIERQSDWLGSYFIQQPLDHFLNDIPTHLVVTLERSWWNITQRNSNNRRSPLAIESDFKAIIHANGSAKRGAKPKVELPVNFPELLLIYSRPPSLIGSLQSETASSKQPSDWLLTDIPDNWPFMDTIFSLTESRGQLM